MIDEAEMEASEPSEWRKRITFAVDAYVASGEEDELMPAYNLAREALQDGASISELISYHHAFLVNTLTNKQNTEEAIERIEGFFIEVVAVYDMALRGFQNNVNRLQSEVTERKRVEEDLRQATHDLELQRDSLDDQVHLRTAELEERAQELGRANALLFESNREQADFTYALSHDLKTPLNTLELYLTALADDFGEALPEEAFELLAIGQSSVGRMRTLIDDVQRYSQTVEHTFTAEVVDLDILMQDIVSDLFAASDGAEIIVGSLPKIHGSPFQLKQLFQNLLSNALKFRSKDRAIRVEVICESADGAGSKKCRISIVDNGIGIADKHMDKIFGLFQRLHTHQEFEGSGIGLAICKRIAENHGAVLDVSSAVGAGTTFTIELPLSPEQ